MQRRNANPSDKPRRNARVDQRSPSNGSARSTSSASKKNTNRVQDPSALANQLKQIDDCARQVKSLMRSLEMSENPRAQAELVRLQKLNDNMVTKASFMQSLLDQYNALEQRQRHLEARSESPAHNVPSQVPLHVADNCVVDDDDDDGNAGNDLDYPPSTREDEENLMQQNAIMRKILDSKKKLVELQDQHSRLASMQKKAENKLAETRAFQDQLALNNPDLNEWVNQIQRESAAGTLLNPTWASRGPKRSASAVGAGRRLQQQHHRGVSAAEAAGGDNNWMWTADTSTAVGTTSAEAELRQLERRLHQLQGMPQQQGVVVSSEVPSAEDLSELCRERRKLQDRLNELHDQKVEMDQLLLELSSLQSGGGLATASAGQAGVGPQGDPVPNGPSNESGFLDRLTLRDKRRQVEEMRHSIQQLRSAVKDLDHPAVTSPAAGILEGATGASVPEGHHPHHGSRATVGSSAHKTDNLRGEFPARRHYEAEGRANEEMDLVGSGAVPTATGPSHAPSGTAQGLSEGDLLAEKVRHLQATRSHLQYLQGIVSSFQDVDLEGDTAASASTSLGEGDSRKQRKELQELQEQQLRLTLLRQQLISSHPVLPPGGKNQLKTSAPDGSRRLDVSPRGGGEASGGHVGGSPPTKKDNVNALPRNLYDVPKSSNRTQDHSSNLECSGTGGGVILLREKAILEELLQQERSKQLLSYSHNEDVRTSPSSESQSSEPLRGPESVVAGGTTTIAATWGGSSTQENLEDDEDDEDPVEDSIEAGHDSEEGSRSDMDVKAESPWIPARERVFSVLDSNASLGRMDNRLSHGSLPRGTTSGACNRSGQWSYGQAAGGSIHRQGSNHREAPVEAVSPQIATDEHDGSGDRVLGVPVFPGWHQQAVHQLHQQLEQTGTLCNLALQEHQQQAFTGALLATSVGAVSPGSTQARPPGFDAVQQYAIQQQQQLLLSIVHCYHLLSIQQLEINQLQHAIQQQVCLNGSEESPPSVPPAFQLPEHTLPGPLFLGSPWAVPPTVPGGMLAQGMPVPNQPSSHSTPEGRGTTLNNQVVPGSRANNFWDNFRSYSRQNLLSTSATMPPKTNELPANFQVQQSQMAGAASGRPKTGPMPRTVGELTAIVPPQDRSRHMRPVANVSLQDALARAAGSRLNVSKQQQPTGFQDGAIPTAVAFPFPYSPAPPRCQQQSYSPPQQPASEALKSSIRAEVSRLLESREDTASLAAVLRQLQFLNTGATATLQQTSGTPQACGGARRKVPSSTKSNIPKENRPVATEERRPLFQRVASESSPDLVTSIDFALDSRPRTEETLSDSTFDKNSSRGSVSTTMRKRPKPLCAASEPPSLPASSTTSAERNVPAEHLVPERDCATDEEQGAAGRPLDLEPTLEQTWPERDITVYIQPLDLLPSANEAAGAEIQVPVLDNAGIPLLPEPVGPVRAGSPEFQAMYNIELALLHQGIAAGGEYQGEEAEDDEDRELETEPEAEGTQDLAEADQSPAAEQDAADQQPEDAAAVVVAPAALGAVGGADGGLADAPVADDGMTRQAASDTPEVPSEDPQQRADGEDNPIRQHDVTLQPPSCE